MQALFSDVNRGILEEPNTETGPSITTEEVAKAIRKLKNNKAAGPDEVYADLLKLIEQHHLDIITELFNYIYDSGTIPEEWLISTFVPIPKKITAKKCEDYRSISLMSHVLKTFLKVIHERIYPKLEEHIGETQFGFRKGLGTREALFSLNVLIQRARDVNCDVFACFIDFEKAFDRVNHRKLLETLRQSGLDDKDIRIISNLYWKQKARVRVENALSGEFEVRQGVRQGCVLSPLLFNVYSERLFREALENAEDGILINGVLINNLRYADDTVLIADTAEGLQRLIDRVTEVCALYNMHLNTNKTKVMIVSKQDTDGQFHANGSRLQMATSINYLGTFLNDKWEQINEIKIRIEKSRAAFNRMRKVLCNLNIGLHLRVRALRCYVFSILTYGVEAWTLTEAACKRLEAFEMWCYRRMLRISWIYHVTNEAVLQRVRKQKEVLNSIKERKLSYFGHVMRNQKYGLLQLIMQGKFNGKRGPGRRRVSWLRNLRQWTGMTSMDLFRAAVNKVRWAIVIANVH